MEDEKIVELYFQRDERAIAETDSKYGKYCYRIAYNILASAEDSEETVNDTYISAWEAMPPHRPSILSAFLAKITRRLSMKKLRFHTAQKRGGSTADLALDELAQCVPARGSVHEDIEAREVGAMIEKFLLKLRADDRRIFVCRYFYLETADDISKEFKYSRSKVYASLERTRERLREYLRKEGVFDEG